MGTRGQVYPTGVKTYEKSCVPRDPVLIPLGRSGTDEVVLGLSVMIRQPDQVAASGAECHQQLSFPAQTIDFKKDLAPGQVSEAVRQDIQVASMHALDGSENTISHGCM
jgi:hypothetical protein